MKLCDRCHLLTGREACPICGKSKYLRDPEENDPVLLITLTGRQSMLVEPILEESGIPYSCPSHLSNVLTSRWAPGPEANRYYVPFSALDEARELIGGTFSESPEILKALNEFVE